MEVLYFVLGHAGFMCPGTQVLCVCVCVTVCACNLRGQEVTRALKERRETRGRQGYLGNQVSLGDQDLW